MAKKETDSTPAFWLAPEVKEIAGPLIDTYHERLGGLRIEYVFCREQPSANGQKALATASKKGGINAFLATFTSPDHDEEFELRAPEPDEPCEFFVMTVWHDGWRELSPSQRVALVDHELCHFGTYDDKEGNLRLMTVPHDLEEFRCIVERHGFWIESVAAFAEAVESRKRERDSEEVA